MFLNWKKRPTRWGLMGFVSGDFARTSANRTGGHGYREASLTISGSLSMSFLESIELAEVLAKSPETKPSVPSESGVFSNLGTYEHTNRNTGTATGRISHC